MSRVPKIHVQVRFKNLQGWRLHTPLGNLCQCLVAPPPGKMGFLMVRGNLLYIICTPNEQRKAQPCQAASAPFHHRYSVMGYSPSRQRSAHHFHFLLALIFYFFPFTHPQPAPGVRETRLRLRRPRRARTQAGLAEPAASPPRAVGRQRRRCPALGGPRRPEGAQGPPHGPSGPGHAGKAWAQRLTCPAPRPRCPGNAERRNGPGEGAARRWAGKLHGGVV